MAKAKQLRMIKPTESDYGGDLQTCRAGRKHGRPLSTRKSMHLVLRSTKATGERSFLRRRNKIVVEAIIAKFARNFSVRILSMANVGNHIHLHIQRMNRFTYFSFIRAVTGGIALAIGGIGEGASKQSTKVSTSSRRFWDRRPFTRIVNCFADFKNVVKYIRINELEGLGHIRAKARQIVEIEFSSG